ncbi:MAG: hypothetical protein P4L87_06250 [Formivibrio sp.]|nr:hypothetical protein [Formivibrio sp.]
MLVTLAPPAPTVQQALRHPRVVQLAASLDIDLNNTENQRALQATAQALLQKIAQERPPQQQMPLDTLSSQSLSPFVRRAIEAYLEVAQM